MAYRVKTAAAVVKIGGSERYMYRGAPVPESATNLEHLLAVGLVEEFELVTVPEPAPREDEGDGSKDPTPPPKGGKGSGDDAWRTYAKAVDVEVPDDASRDAVIAAVEAAGKPTE